ncbi:checkpoint protein HUS1 [Acyrthosiphon pisum]|uniref:Checkpoint protein n=1 Tax=Acyrthosiphon pisum TaxID=7029 RepID=A0A8R2A5N4_ACYPI|nr:checkpoint protein HUS1 [Acyrthosiphon pisum]XP_008188226.1 checkpoint protein HUS1 [Acyrthosiphon pisum]|eukprot:XP_001950666.2 PREDICTED: checkpoint protein HUS1 [Acyrthosiphon pisum]
MKFRGKIIDPHCMKQFYSIVIILSKLCRNVVLRLSSTKLYLIASNESNSNQISVWSVLDQQSFFKDYDMIGETESNEILFSLPIDMLASSLSSAKQTNLKTLKMKLTDKLSPCLTIELDLESQVSSKQLCTHDIPVSVILPKDWSAYKEPTIPAHNISVVMPSIRVVRHIVDKMKRIGPRLIVSLDSSGKMVLGVSNLSATVDTHFIGLEIVSVHNLTDKENKYSTVVDIKKFSQFLNCETLNLSKILCHVVEGMLLHCSIEEDEYVLHYFLSGIDD